jgi:hypothetical protein
VHAGLISFIIKAATLQQIETFCNSLSNILMAVSWGGHESLVIPKCVGITASHFNPLNKDHRMIRVVYWIRGAGIPDKGFGAGAGLIKIGYSSNTTNIIPDSFCK